MKKRLNPVLKTCFAATAIIATHSALAFEATRPPVPRTPANLDFPYSQPVNPNAAVDGKPYLAGHGSVMTLAGAHLPPVPSSKPSAPAPSRTANNNDFPYSQPVNPNASVDGNPYLAGHGSVMTLAGAHLPPVPSNKPSAPAPSRTANNNDFPYSQPVNPNASVDGNPYLAGHGSVMTLAGAHLPPVPSEKNRYNVRNTAYVQDADNLKNREILSVLNRMEGNGERVFRERRIGQVEVYSLRTENRRGQGHGLLVAGKIPTASGNVFFGEWAPATDTAATVNLKGNAQSAWFAGKNPTGSTKGLASATYSVVGINGHNPGARDFYTGDITARFGTGDTGSMSGKLTRQADTLDFSGVKIDNRNGTFASDAALNREGIKGQFFGQNAAALAGTATRGTDSRSDDISFGGVKQ